jgi:hypothetical protein
VDPTLYRNDTYDRVLVANPADGRVHWRPASSIAPPDCKWTITNNLWNHVYTAVGAANLPWPDDFDAVGVGIDLAANPAPAAKFTVKTDVYDEAVGILQSHSDANVYGLRINSSGGTQNNYGARILSTANNTTAHNYGLFTEALGSTPRSRAVSARTNGATFTAYCGEFLAYDAASWTHGVTGRAYGGSSRHGVEGLAFAGSAGGGAWGAATELFGVSAKADGGGASPIGYGVYATATGSTVNWAGYFAGDVQAGNTYLPSDAQLKSLIEADADEVASDVLQGLHPRAYVYNTDAYPSMHLPTGQQYGLLAQEVEAVLPGLVKESVHPAQVDHEGNVVAEAVSFKSVNYVGLIPYLIAGHQAQQREVEALRASLQELQDQLAACCASTGSDHRMAPATSTSAPDELLLGQERLLRIAPNPFTDRTTLYCNLERSGRMQLLVNSSDGRDLRVLYEAQREAGEFQHEWSTANLAPGVYYITLLLDGEPLVKRAVRVRE